MLLEQHIKSEMSQAREIGSIRDLGQRKRPKLSLGLSGRSGHWSSRYSQMSVDSMMTLPSFTSVGTTAFGFSLGIRASARRRGADRDGRQSAQLQSPVDASTNAAARAVVILPVIVDLKLQTDNSHYARLDCLVQSNKPFTISAIPKAFIPHTLAVDGCRSGPIRPLQRAGKKWRAI
jgi:hypothetical protein